MICKLYEMTIHRLHGKPEEWTAYRFSACGPPGFIKITGSVPVGVYQRGPRKGRPKWNLKLGEDFWISQSQVEETRSLWELTHGKCYECDGTGQATYGWSSKDGELKGPCRRCKATGIHPRPKEPTP